MIIGGYSEDDLCDGNVAALGRKQSFVILTVHRLLSARSGQSDGVSGQEKVLCKHISSVERYSVTYSQCSRRLNNGVHTHTGEQSGIANLNSVVSNECAEDSGVPG